MKSRLMVELPGDNAHFYLFIRIYLSMTYYCTGCTTIPLFSILSFLCLPLIFGTGTGTDYHHQA